MRLMLALALALLAAGPAVGADIAIDRISDNYNNGWSSNTLTWQHTIGGQSNRILVVGVTLGDVYASNRTVTSVTYNGVNLTKIREGTDGLECGASMWYLLNAGLPAAGTYNIVVTTASTVGSLAGYATSFYNAAQQGPEASRSTGGYLGTAPSFSLNTLTNGALVLDILAVAERPNNLSLHENYPSGQTATWISRIDVPPYNWAGHMQAASYAIDAVFGQFWLGYRYPTASNGAWVIAAFTPAAGAGGTYHTITAGTGAGADGGAVSPASQSVLAGNSATISITPQAGWSIASIVDNGTTVPIASPYVISNVNMNHNVVVSFSAPDSNTITASVGGGVGSVNPAVQSVPDEGTASISIVPGADMAIESIVDNGSSMPIANPYVISSVTQDHSVVVTFSSTAPPPDPAECVEISDIPLDVRVRPAPPLVMFVLDDSGSMDWEFMTYEQNGLFEMAGYVFDNAGDNSSYQAILNSDQRKKWKSQWHGYNKMYYNPNVTYNPWPGMSNASTSTPRSNPYYASPTFNLANEYVTLSGGVSVNRAHYYTWDDANGNGERDAGERAYLVNFFKNTMGGPLEGRTFYEYNDNGDNIVVSSELTFRSEDSLPASVRPKTWTEDLQNFANWYSFYRKRFLASNGAMAQFIDQAEGMKIGVYGINGSIVQPVLPVHVSGVDETATLLDVIYGAPRWNSMTPTKTGLENVGKYFDQSDGGATGGIGPSPFDSAEAGGGCQQAFAIIISDGDYNTGTPSVGNADGNKGAPYADSYSNTLADVAMYYYARDLCPDLPDDVPTNRRDTAAHQHLVTYGVGFGVVGSLNPDDYDIENGIYPTWPNPTGVNEKITDIWHATVNGRGRFVTSHSAQELADELLGFMEEIKVLNLSGAPVTVNGDELYSKISDEVRLFQSKFYSETWNGDVLSFAVNSTTGAVILPALWSAAWQLRNITPDNRKIATYDGTSGGIPFRFDSLTNLQKSVLDLNWPSNATLARRIVDYLRGDGTYEKDNGGTFRNRTWSISDDFHPQNGQIIASSKLGDIVNSSPVHKNGVLYAGSNDGMLHAIDAANGNELFAYVPHLVFHNLAALKDAVYSHTYYVDQSPAVAYIDMAGMSHLLVGGLGKGGKGYYALDVSGVRPDSGQVPATESAVAAMVKWEYPNRNSADDEKADMGYSFGRPIIVQSNDSRYPWVVIVNNGYNSTNGNAVLFILDPDTGTLIQRIDTQAGPCNGLSTAIAVDKNRDDKVDYVYAGDLLGHLWKFDLSHSDASNWNVAFLEGGVPKPLFKTPGQPITAKPDVMRHCTKEGYMVLFGTGRYLDEDDLTDTSQQAIYGIWDYGDDEDDREYVGTFSGASFTDSPLPNTVSLLSQAVASGGLTTVNGKYLRALTDNLPNWMVTTHNGVTCGENSGSILECDPGGGGSNPDPLRTVGWRFNLPSGGERVVGNVMVRGGILIAVTNIPQASVCSSAASSWIMEMNACSGSRLTEAQFDINGDGVINEQDLVNIGTIANPIMVAPSGIHSEGRLKEPPILRKGNVEVMYMSSSGGQIITEMQRTNRMGLQWWRPIRP